MLPKDTVRTALAGKLIDEGTATTFLAAIDDRNRMVHDYSEEFALALHARVKERYVPAFRKLLDSLDSIAS